MTTLLKNSNQDMYSTFYKKPFFAILLILSLSACSSKKDNSSVSVKDSLPAVDIKHDTANDLSATRPPIINITDTLIKAQLVLYVKDSAATSSRINLKLAQVYKVLLPSVAKVNNIVLMGAPMAWYKNQDMPFYFEAGFTIDKKPTKKLPAKVFVKSIGGDSAVVAHFYGPYEITAMGYEALNDWMKNNKKKSSAKPYEVYVTDPFAISMDKSNPYRVRTDIYLPHK